MNNLKTQMMGLALASVTAIGCVIYEKLVQRYSMPFVICICITEYFTMIFIALFLDGNKLKQDLTLASLDWKSPLLIMAYVATGATTILWYRMTKDNGVLVSGVLEMKYIVILAIFYSIIGQRKIDRNVIIGVVLAIISFYFVTKKQQ